MTDETRPARLFGFGHRPEDLLRHSPRTLEIGCSLIMGILAALLFYDFVIHRWFYANFHQYYRTTSESRIYDWSLAIGEIVGGAWSTGLAISLLRGESTRRDRGLFSPVALRLWGCFFAIAPLAMFASSPHVTMHLVFLSWAAAGACFKLASQRGAGSGHAT